MVSHCFLYSQLLELCDLPISQQTTQLLPLTEDQVQLHLARPEGGGHSEDLPPYPAGEAEKNYIPWDTHSMQGDLWGHQESDQRIKVIKTIQSCVLLIIFLERVLMR